MNDNKQSYGCEVCKHAATCAPNPFGICKDFKEEEKEGSDR